MNKARYAFAAVGVASALAMMARLTYHALTDSGAGRRYDHSAITSVFVFVFCAYGASAWRPAARP